jgi:hypothetical protein
MKKLNVLFTLMTIGFFGTAFGQSTIAPTSKTEFKAPGLEDSVKKHKLVAILPFTTTITYKVKLKHYDSTANKLEEQKLRVSMQEGMHTFLLNKGEDYFVKFQDVTKTNIILKNANLFDSIETILPEDLAKILGVDAVIKSRYDYVKKKSKGDAFIEAYYLGAEAAKTATGALIMQIYSGTSGTLLYRFYKELGEDMSSNPSEIMKRLMRKVAYNFPYKIE